MGGVNRSNSLTGGSHQSQGDTHHHVRSGETLSQIASHYKVSITDLMHANHQLSNPDRIFAGQTLTIPRHHGRSGSVESNSDARTYTVKPGDTLSAIAARQGIDMGRLLRANVELRHHANSIHPGDHVNLPDSERTAKTIPPPRTTRTNGDVTRPPAQQPRTVPQQQPTPTQTPVRTNPTTSPDEPQTVETSPHLRLKSKNIELSPLVRAKMSRIADEYFKKTGKDLVITDGNRTAHDQAERIYDKIQHHGEHIYTNKAALAEIKAAYNEGAARGESREQIVGRMERAIQNQASRNVFISKHLIGQGADVRIKDMSLADRRAFLDTIAAVGGARKLNEGDHWHIEVDGNSRQTLPNQTPQTTRVNTESQPPQATTGRTTGELKLGVNEEYHDALILAQTRTGIDAAALASVINAEAARDKSGKWLANSQSPKGTARGLTQFLKGTWLERAHVQGSYLNQVALQKGFIREEKGRIIVVDENSLLALRDNPTVSIVTAAEYGRDNLELLNRSGLLPGNLSDDQKAKYMYVAHHEGFGGALRYLTNSNDVSEDTAKYILTKNRAAGLKDTYGSYTEAYKHWAEDTSHRTFPFQVGSKTMNAYVQKYGNYEQGYRAWLRDYVNAKIQPEHYRK